jgi:hypothetical protein
MRAGAIFIDLRKAFNSVNHDLLILKLIQANIDPNIVKFFKNYLDNRVFKVRIGNSKSKYFRDPAGVPQGSSIASILFSIFIDDIGNAITSPYTLYADDIVVLTSHTDVKVIVHTLETELLSIKKWCCDNLLNLNEVKTEFMLFHKANDTSYESVPPLLLDGKEIKRVYKFKYLGVFIDPSLSFRPHYQHVESKMSCAIGRIRGINRLLTDDVFITLIKAYVIPIYDYCLDIWAVLPDSDMTLLQRKIDRLIISHFLPSIVRKLSRKKNNLNNLDLSKKNIDMNPYLIRCNILSVSERVIWTLVKNIHACLVSPIASINTIYQFSENQRTSRTFPLLKVEHSNSKTLRNSLKFRGIQAWNAMPKEWNLYIENDSVVQIISSDQFKTCVSDFLIERRSNLCFSF